MTRGYGGGWLSVVSQAMDKKERMIDQRAHLERLTVYVLWYSAARSEWKAQTAQTGYGRTGAGI